MEMNTVLFDLDGTLLPMSEETFTKVYFRELSLKMQPEGFEPEQLIKAIWTGTKRMMKNDGSMRNDEAFWDEFEKVQHCDVARTRRKCDEFYEQEFERVRYVVGDAPFSASVVRSLKAKGYKVALATNPIFPLVAVKTRLRWIGLAPEDFDFVTTYENSRFCKPNPGYYRAILEALDVKPEDCLMVGNNVTEDMCFAGLGGQVYLVTDHVENPKGEDKSAFRQGTMEQFAQVADALPWLRGGGRG